MAMLQLSFATLATCLIPSVALAAPPSGDAEAGASIGTDGVDGSASAEAKPPRAKKDKRKHLKWIKRWAPERNMGEIGLYGGVLLPSRSLELFEADRALPDQGFKQFKRVAPEFGGRLGYYPIRFFGLEVEGGAALAKTTAGDRATMWTARGHLVAQLGLASITPFILVGTGALGVSSDRAAVGSEVDMALHFGGGLKFFLARYVALRFDVRDVVTAQRGVKSGLTNNLEVLGGLSITLGRKDKPKPGPKDTDGDGFMDPDDHCVNEPGVAPHGCPIRDKDGDGFLDDVDACIDEPGVAPDGCPIRDKDGDGFLDDVDACIDEPGVAPDGCPIRDTDGDGIMDPDDGCINEPETKNGYLDTDGCPDEVPKEVERFTGVIEGIFFDTAKATIRPTSRAKLDKAIEVLKKFPVRVEISGHTDNVGKRDYNVDLSARRAEAVKQYLTDAGIEASRIETRGAGPDEPIADNKSKAGKAKNRRIEFKLLTQ